MALQKWSMFQTVHFICAHIIFPQKKPHKTPKNQPPLEREAWRFLKFWISSL